ncbi:MAG: C40 family peptidase [Bacteroidetes bacterium]|nr:C40 family peptidase [Bacteroidota bacterium]
MSNTTSIFLAFSLVFLSFQLTAGIPEGSSPENELRKKKIRRYYLVADHAKKYQGIRYVYGGSTPSGFDCSGFTAYVFNKFDIQLPRTAAEQGKTGKRVGKRRARPGDLIFFKGSDNKSRKIGHVGIVISKKGQPIEFVHASSSKGIIISKLSEAYYDERYKKIRRFKSLRKKQII